MFGSFCEYCHFKEKNYCPHVIRASQFESTIGLTSLISDNMTFLMSCRGKDALRGRFTCASDRYTRLTRRDAYGARACKDSRSVSTDDYSKDIGILVVGRIRRSGVPVDPFVSRTRSCNSDSGKPDRSRLSSRRI